MARRQRPNLFFTGCGASWAEKATGKVPLALLRDPEAQADAAMLVSIEPARAGVDLHDDNNYTMKIQFSPDAEGWADVLTGVYV